MVVVCVWFDVTSQRMDVLRMLLPTYIHYTCKCNYWFTDTC